MLTIAFQGNRHVAIEEFAVPIPKPGEVLLKIGASAICGSEMKHYRNADGTPVIQDWTGRNCCNPGHEMTGTVIENPAGRGPRVGDRVSINIITGCGECTTCRRGDRRFCTQQGFVMGAHTEYIAVPDYTCMPLPDDIPFDVGVLLGGDMLGVAYHAFAKVRLSPRDKVVVVGGGPVGLGFLAMLHYLGLETMLVEPSAYRRQLAADSRMAYTLDPGNDNVSDAIQERTHGTGADVVVEASGTDAGVNLGLNVTRPKGTFIFAGAGREAKINPWTQFLEKELTAYGVWYFVDADYYGILDIYRKGLQVASMLTHRFALHEATEAYQLMDQALTGKAVFTHAG